MPRREAGASRRRLLVALGMLLLVAGARAESGKDRGRTGLPRLRAVLVTTDGRHPLELELAATPEARMRGLMHRERVAEGTGMLFDFGSERRVSMWMKDTPASLDMLFLDAELRVVHIVERTEPFSLAAITAPVPVRWVLEVPAGTVARSGARVGDRLEVAWPEDRPVRP
ncbi:hypothetical protein HRbin39_01799 [bacterium HR39]|nr:hypothetical protein HRbin39_01799 [bacterium HR39]